MEFIVAKDYDELSQKAADIIADIIKNKENPILGLATGSTPIGTYQKLVEKNKNGEISFKNTVSVNLDEYLGLDPSNDQSYHYFMNDNLFDHVDIDKNNVHVPEGGLENPEEDAKKYDELLKEVGRRDVQVLGIGNNGHIAFNEPADQLNVNTGIVDLTESTIEANKRFFNSVDEVPTRAISMGLGGIFNAEKIILLISGKNKHDILVKLLEDQKIDTHIPASLLALHKDLVVIVDEEAYNG
ncbi:MAG: glucosamine-6-phosphate deaminase [Finegoldia sp.]|nr:glucosamine-6-phosphate deaminase [Finegoldia sp.]